MQAMKPRLLASAALLFATPALAEEEIVVTGQPLPASIGEAAYDVAVVDRDRIVATASGRIERRGRAPPGGECVPRGNTRRFLLKQVALALKSIWDLIVCWPPITQFVLENHSF